MYVVRIFNEVFTSFYGKEINISILIRHCLGCGICGYGTKLIVLVALGGGDRWGGRRYRIEIDCAL